MFNHEAIDFSVEKFPLVDVPSDIGVGLRRKDTGETLAIVSEQYTPPPIVTGKHLLNTPDT